MTIFFVLYGSARILFCFQFDTYPLLMIMLEMEIHVLYLFTGEYREGGDYLGKERGGSGGWKLDLDYTCDYPICYLTLLSLKWTESQPLFYSADKHRTQKPLKTFNLCHMDLVLWYATYKNNIMPKKCCFTCCWYSFHSCLVTHLKKTYFLSISQFSTVNEMGDGKHVPQRRFSVDWGKKSLHQSLW